ncbi:MAG TPA: nucleotidyltransferase family protein [Puia sp.]|nr:nucleotidyltransferase family protein [Puia sp.]
MLSAILLAAGSSTRMAPANKLLLPWQHKPIVYHTANHLLASGIEELIVVTGHDAAAITAALHPLPARFVHNPEHTQGLTGSITSGVRMAHGKGYMICLADMFLITTPEYVLLRKAFEQQYRHDVQCIILPGYQGHTGNPVIFSSFYRDALLSLPEREGGRSLVRAHPDHHHRVPMPTDHVLRDLDTPGDYEALVQRRG